MGELLWAYGHMGGQVGSPLNGIMPHEYELAIYDWIFRQCEPFVVEKRTWSSPIWIFSGRKANFDKGSITLLPLGAASATCEWRSNNLGFAGGLSINLCLPVGHIQIPSHRKFVMFMELFMYRGRDISWVKGSVSDCFRNFHHREERGRKGRECKISN